MSDARALSVVVYPHSMELGGSQINAIDLAAAVRDLGHDVVVYGERGVLEQRVRDHGLRYVAAAEHRLRPSPVVARDLRRLAREVRADVLHGYEWPPALECRAATTGTRRAAVVTVMSMAVAPFLPSSMPLVVGTEQIRASVAHRRAPVHLLEPPVDTVADRPGAGGQELRRELGIGDHETVVVIVSRLVRELKLEGILTTIAAVGELGADADVRLLVVGDGPERPQVEAAALAADAAAGRRVVHVLGELTDPRPAYDAADIAVGMGGSALRSLAFASPLVVQGEGGFFALLDEESLPVFLEQGWYGVADRGPREACDALVAVLRALHASPDLRERLGQFGRTLVEDRFSLARAARTQVDVYRAALAAGPRGLDRVADDARALVGLAGYKVRRRVERRRGTARVDDFNARPLAAAPR